MTKTGDVSMVDDLDLLNVTSSGVASNAQAVEADLDTGELDFDLDAELEAAPAAAEKPPKAAAPPAPAPAPKAAPPSAPTMKW